MKKILFWSAAVLLAAVSCNKELETAPVSEGDTVSFIATVDGGETELDSKTVLGGDRTPMWSGWELITILDGTNRFIFSTNAETPSNTSVFSYSGETKPADKVLAVYPSDNTFADDKKYSANIETKTVSGISFPVNQVVVEGTYPADAAFAAAYSEGNTLQFRNAVAIIAFSVKDTDITYGCLYANNGGNITGTYDLTFSNLENDAYDYEVPVLTPTAGAAWADFHSNGVPMATDKIYYIAIAPTTFPKGFSVSLNGRIAKSTDKEVTFERNVIYNIGQLELPEEVIPDTWYVSGTMNGWSLDNQMTLEGDWYVAKNITITTSDMFKFRSDEGWTDNRGNAGSEIIADREYAVEYAADGNISVAASAIYDVYLSKDATVMKIIKVGNYADSGLNMSDFSPVEGKVAVYAETVHTYLWCWNPSGPENYTTGTWPGVKAVEVSIAGKTYKRFEVDNEASGKLVKALLSGTGEQTFDSEQMYGASVMVLKVEGRTVTLMGSK